MAYNQELRQKTKEDFVKYLEEHPDERFVNPVDTFYWEGKDGDTGDE